VSLDELPRVNGWWGRVILIDSIQLGITVLAGQTWNRWLDHLRSFISEIIGVSASQLRPVDHIGDVQYPVFIISGEKDRNTRPADTRMLFEHARSPKQLWFVPNAGNVDLHRAAREEYEIRVLAFLAQMARSSTPEGLAH
jgi:esterase/lipase